VAKMEELGCRPSPVSLHAIGPLIRQSSYEVRAPRIRQPLSREGGLDEYPLLRAEASGLGPMPLFEYSPATSAALATRPAWHRNDRMICACDHVCRGKLFIFSFRRSVPPRNEARLRPR